MSVFVKIALPGERPWAEVLLEINPSTSRVRIDNKVAGDYTAKEYYEVLSGLFGQDTEWDGKDMRLHTYKQDDVVTVHQKDGEWHVVVQN